MNPRRYAIASITVQGVSAACVGAWAGSITAPPDGIQWTLLGLGVVLAGVAVYLHARAA